MWASRGADFMSLACRPGSVTDATQRERQIQLLVEREAERGLQTLELDHSGRWP